MLRVLYRDEVDEVEEGGLERDVDVAAEMVLFGYLRRVYRVELRVFAREFAADVRGYFLLKLVRLPRAVEQQRAALLELADYVVVLLCAATKSASLTRYDERIGVSEKRRCDIVTPKDFFASYSK